MGEGRPFGTNKPLAPSIQLSEKRHLADPASAVRVLWADAQLVQSFDPALRLAGLRTQIVNDKGRSHQQLVPRRLGTNTDRDANASSFPSFVELNGEKPTVSSSRRGYTHRRIVRKSGQSFSQYTYRHGTILPWRPLNRTSLR
jgi:hypothetical protein